MKSFKFWGETICSDSLLIKFLFDKKVKRDFRKLRPTVDVFPAFFVGGILTWSFIQADQVQLLFGMWMSIYGLMSLANRHVLPRFHAHSPHNPAARHHLLISHRPKHKRSFSTLLLVAPHISAQFQSKYLA